ncbi:MAG: biopolymer transporter ExbD [Pirellulales bacterium]|jgi:biopolymer transport protein ExbD|nr:biopolymer transporter ExbD [Pirellulales bacterium]
MSASLSGNDRCEPNLTPILDMVFQLITFFMLVVNFKAASVNLALNLPVLGSAAPVEDEGTELLVLNIDAEGQLHAYGDIVEPEAFIKSEAQTALRLAQVKQPNLKLGDELPVTVVVRADKEIPFHLLNRIIRNCQTSGFRKFQYRAMSKVEGA